MNRIKKFSAVWLAVMIVFASFGTTVLSTLAETADETTTAITQSPTDFLYEQAVQGATAEGATNPTTGNNRIAISQTGAWRVAGVTAGGTSFADVTGYWLRYNSASSIDARYGFSTWSYTTPSIRVNYKNGDTSKKVLTTLLRPNSTPDGDRKNAFMSLYYIAEASGDYSLIDNLGGFLVRESAAYGYEVYVTILANGQEIFKSQPLSRINRIARFNGATFYLEQGQKLEIKFTYEYTSETYSGDIEIDFDPYITLVEEWEKVTANPVGVGYLPDMYYNEVTKLDPAGNSTQGTNKVAVEQTGVWRSQLYNSGWKDLNYYKIGTSVDNSMEWGYNDGSHTQTDMIAVCYYNGHNSNPKILRAKIPMTRWNMKQLRYAYTAEYDGTYTLTDKYEQFVVNTGALTVYDYWVQITHNDNVLWKSDILANKGDVAPFKGVTVDMTAGDTLAIEFRYKKKADATATYDTTRCDVNFAPNLSFVQKAKSETYNAKQAFIDTMSAVRAEDATENASGTITQPSIGWIFEHGKSFAGLTPLTHYGYTVGVWGSSRLQPADSQKGGEPGIIYDTGSSHTYYKKLYMQIRSAMELNGSGIRDSYYAYDYAYTFKAPRSGAYIFSETNVNLLEPSTISGIKALVYKDGVLLYSTDTVSNDNTSETIPEMRFLLDAGSEITVFFERQHKPEDANYNHYMYVECDPTITYYEDTSIIDGEKSGYAPKNTTRYYAENLTVPSDISVYVNTDAVVAGNIIDSDAFSLEILAGAIPAVNYNTADGVKTVQFPVSVKGGWVKLQIAYDTADSSWKCYVNDLLVSTVSDTDFVSGGSIEKLYIGASADIYNNGSFKGEISELSLSADGQTTSFALSDITTEEGLLSETVSYTEDHNGVGMTFKNKNSRIDLYDVSEKPVATFEAWVKLPTDYMDNKSAGRLLGNSYNFRPYSQLNVVAGGKPQIVVCPEDGAEEKITFNVDIRSDEFIHLAITADSANGLYKCYVDGVLVDTVASTMEIPVGLRPYLISGDYYHNNAPVNFEGDLAGLALFTDVRTQEEILEDIYGQTELSDSELFGKWSMFDKEDGLINQNGSGIDLHPFWETEPDCKVDESYGKYSTFVFIPDTQNFTQSQGSEGLDSIVNWILSNKESENIIGVMGLGDITNTNSKSQWAEAQTSFEKLKGEVPFVFVEGNHDIEFNNPDPNNPRNTTNFNTYFPFDTWSPYIDGYFEEGKIDNMYVLTEDSMGNKYMMLGLEFQPRDAVLEWANEVVAQHPDYNVVVSTHGYQQYDHETKKQYHISSDGYTDILGTDSNVGAEIWDKFVRKHANITTVVCGHVYQEDIHVTTNVGDNGNVVTEIISNAQTTDVLMRMSGTITIVRVSEDGTKANVNQYAAHHGNYMKDINQFEMPWNMVDTTPDVAEVNGVGYETLAAAVEAANAGDTVTLIADASGKGMVIDKDITIDFGGYTYTITDVADSESDGLQLLDGNNITLKNGTLKVADGAAQSFGVLVQNYSNLTVTDMTLDGTNLDKAALTDGDSYVLSNKSGTVSVNGDTNIIANNDGDKAIAFDVCQYGDYAAPSVSIDITGTVYGKIEVSESIAENLTVKNGRFENSNIMDVANISEKCGIKLVDGVYTVAGDSIIADIDGSGTVDANDITNIRKQLLGVSLDQGYYDINGDGNFNIIDLIRIKKLAAS